LSLMSSQDLGSVDKIIVGQNSTVILKDNIRTEEINNRIKELKFQQDTTTDVSQKTFINERIASLSGGIGCIYVGGNSDVEQKEKFDRVDDSVCAVRSAMQEGIIAGGGQALWDASDSLLDCNCGNKDANEIVAKTILIQALKSPLIQIIKNAGLDYEKITDLNNIPKDIFMTQKNVGYDVKNEKYGDMFKMGVIDPLKVTKHALNNAISVATTILSTNAIITHKRI